MLDALRGSCLRVGVVSCLTMAPALSALSALSALPVLPGAPRAAAAARGQGPEARVACTVSDPRITEASGLAVSRRHRGIVYIHNDSGDGPRIFAVGPDGRTRATFTVAGAGNRDWEGMALGRDGAGRPALFVADIGDNLGGEWPFVTVYRVREPAHLRSQTLRATAFRLKYRDGPRNAESVLIDPRTNRLYVASKRVTGAALYAAPARLSAGGVNVLRKVGGAPPVATDAAFAPDGRTFVIRTYTDAHVYAMSGARPGRRLDVVSLPDQDQGESIAYGLDGTSLLAGSEGTDQPLWRVPLPAAALPAPRATSSRSPAAAPREPSERHAGRNALGLGLVAIAAVAAVVVIRRRRA
ncbi:MAG TPA: hypothetical protein VFU43_08380 [Streptosporangiaceae bacterium]|nr:hypothetical protein [Streptosporangiaceae bacterium]